MNKPGHFYTIENSSVAEFKDRGSKFIAYAYPLENTGDFKKIWQQLKKDHPKAVHHCFAYRLGINGDNFRCSDDGEPAGSAGKPILGQIDSKKLTNILIIVVRYFGGTLLGVPGLINAYKSAASLALQIIPVISKQVVEEYEFHFDYTAINEIMRILKLYNCNIIEQQLYMFCVIRAGIPVNSLKEVISKINELNNIEAKKIV